MDGLEDDKFCLPDSTDQLAIGFKLGEGSFAEVFEGFDKILKVNVAVKIFDKSKVMQYKDSRQLIEQELSILCKLPTHANVC